MIWRVRTVVIASVLMATTCGLGMTTGPVSGATPVTLFVANAGTDTGACTSPTTPCTTISYALSQDGGGGVTIDVSGTIRDNVDVTPAASPFAGQVTRQAVGGSPAVIDGGAAGIVFAIQPMASVVLDHLRIENGSGGAVGGGIEVFGDGGVTVEDSSITGNLAQNSSYQGDAQGAGIWAYNAEVTISDSTISGNAVIANNNGSGEGGAIYSYGGEMSMTNSTIAANSVTGGTSAYGGAISLDGGSQSQIVASTISGNSVTAPSVIGGALYNTFGTSTTFAGDIMASASGPPAAGECGGGGQLTDAGYNIDDDGTCGLFRNGSTGDSLTIDGSLSPLGGNGGPTQTILPVASSPAAWVIPPNTTVSGISLCSGDDQRGAGFPRPTTGASSCSLGAVEANNLIPQAISFTSTPPPYPQVGGSYVVTANGGGSENPVQFASATTTVCTVTGSDVSVGVGTCNILANQDGSSAYAAAPQVSQSFPVHPSPSVANGTLAAPVVGMTSSTTEPGIGWPTQ